MKMPKDFSKRMTGLAEEIPSQVIEALLKTLLPRQPVRTREAQPIPAGMMPDAQPRGFRSDHTGLGKPKRTRLPKRVIMAKRYELTSKGMSKFRRVASDDHFVEIAKHEGDTVQHAILMADNVQYADITYAERVGLIRFID